MELNYIPLKNNKSGIHIPMGYFWFIFIISVTPTLLSVLGIEISYDDYKIITFSKNILNVSTELILGRTFTTIWVILSVAVGFFTCILTLIDFKVKKDIVAPVIGLILVFTSIFDMVQLLIILGAIHVKLGLDQMIYMSWFMSRILHVGMLLAGTIFILFTRPDLVKSAKQKINSLKIVAFAFSAITLIAIIYLFSLGTISEAFIQRGAFFTHPFEIIPIILYLIWGGLIMPRVLKIHQGIFFQMLILSMIPAVFSNVHMSIFFKNFDIEYNFAQFLKLFTYIVPLMGISLNYSRNIVKQHQMNMILDEEIKAKEKVQQDLERRQSLLQNAESLANMGSWDLDVVTNEINFSDALYKIFGYKPNSISPNLELMINMIIPDHRATYKKMLDEAITNQSSFNAEYEVLWVNGERRYILAQCRYISSDNKIIGTCLDISELRVTTQKLSQNEILLKEAESISHNGSFEWFNGVDYIFWSEELFRIHGFEPNAVNVTFNFYESLIHPEDLKRLYKLKDKIATTKSNFALEYKIIRPDKEIRYVYLTAKIILNNDETINKIIGNLQDITELKNAAILLEKTESIYKTIASNVPDSIVLMFDRNHQLILFDGPILQQVNFKNELVTGIHLKNMFADEDYQLYFDVLNKAFEGEETQIEKELSGERIFMIDFKPVMDISGNIFNVMVVMHDITEIKKVQKSLEVKVDELNSSNQDLEQFAYVASHDLQEPLRKIRSFGDRLQTKFSKDIAQEGIDYIKRMQSASERMQTLIDDLLMFSRVTRTDEGYVEVDLHDHLSKIIEDLEFTIEKKNATIDLMVNHTIKAIPGQIRQLFQNLMSNAIKFAKETTAPVVEIKSEILRGDEIGDTLVQQKDYCVITVKDNGIGFDQQYEDKIFELFQRLHTRNEYQGTGIGLAVCKKIVEKHSGLISVTSVHNEGTTFSIILPVNQ